MTSPQSRAAVDDEYMTVAEFAALPSAAHHAVWQAHAGKRVDVIPVARVYRYHRAQVLALLREAEAAR
jgi:hypothetical protein